MTAQTIEVLPFNLLLFAMIAAGPETSAGVVRMASYIAEFAPYFVLTLLGTLWLWGAESMRRNLFTAGSTAVLGVAMNVLIGAVFPQPRPFELGLGQNLLHHAAEASFPSDHATLIWALGFGLLADSRSFILGVTVTALGFAVAWARVFLGVHFPLDMIGSLAVALTSAIIIRICGAWLYDVTYRPLAERLALRFRRYR
jgi:undecaprenyl-diphosphatase